MKKIMSIIAALAMLMAMVGCDWEPAEFSPKTETISYNDTAYPFTGVDVVLGKTVLEAEMMSSSNHVSISLTSNEPGNAGVVFYSKDYRKVAEHSVNVLGSGSIYPSFSPLKYTTYNSTSSGYNHNESWWKDDPSDDIGCGKAGMYFYDYTNYEVDGNNDPIPQKEAYIYVKGDIIYYLKYDSDNTSLDGSSNYYYKWARGVATKNGDNISIVWSSTGDLNDRTTVNVSSTTEKLIATNETITNNAASIVPSTLKTAVKFMYSSSQKEVVFGTNDLVFKLQDDNSPYSFPTDKEWKTLD